MAGMLQESKRNVLKDFVHIAGPLGVTQFLILTATENACYLRIAKAPRVSSHQLPCRSAFMSVWDNLVWENNICKVLSVMSVVTIVTMFLLVSCHIIPSLS